MSHNEAISHLINENDRHDDIMKCYLGKICKSFPDKHKEQNKA